VKGLRTLSNTYKKPMTDNMKRIKVSIEDIKSIFSNSDTILELHQILLTKFKQDPSNVVATLDQHAAYFKMYTQYMSGYEKALQTMDKLCKNKTFQSFLIQQRESGDGNGPCLDIMSYLITPVQRIPRYELLLREILKKTPDDSDQKQLTEKTYQHIRSIAMHINEKKREVENITKLVKIQNGIRGLGDFAIFEPSRHLCKEGALHLQKNTDKSKERLVYLFNDILLWTNVKSEYKGHLELVKCSIHDSLPDDEDDVMFEIHGAGLMLKISFDLPAQKKEWIEAIQKLLEEQKNIIDRTPTTSPKAGRGLTRQNEIRNLLEEGKRSNETKGEEKEIPRENSPKMPPIEIEKMQKIAADESAEAKDAKSIPIGASLSREFLLSFTKEALVDAVLEREQRIQSLQDTLKTKSNISSKRTPTHSRTPTSARISKKSVASSRRNSESIKKSPHTARGIHRVLANRNAEKTVNKGGVRGLDKVTPRINTGRGHTHSKSPVRRSKATEKKANSLLRKKPDYLSTIKPGCPVEYDGKKGTAKFVGPVHFRAGIWVGIELEEKLGKHNGTIKGRRYFYCKTGYGVLVPAAKVTVEDDGSGR